MHSDTRNTPLSRLRGALELIAQPFAWSATAPAALHSVLRRALRAYGRAGPAAARASLDTGRWSLELLKHLEWRRFEDLCGAYFATQHDAGQAAILVHCKAWDAHRVGIKPARALRAAMSAAGAADGVLVTSGQFTRETTDYAAKEGLRLIDGAALLGRLAALPPEQSQALLSLATQGDYLTPSCPCCSIKMTARRSTAEGRTFWGCPNYPRCKEILFGAGVG